MLSVIRRARQSLGRVCLVLGAMVLSACVPSSGPSTVPAGKGGAVQVALLVPSGSGQSQDELFGANLENAARLAMADLSGVKVDLRVYKTGGSPAQAAALVPVAVAGLAGWAAKALMDGIFGLMLGIVVMPLAKMIGPLLSKVTGKTAAH